MTDDEVTAREIKRWEIRTWLEAHEVVGFEHALQDCRPGDADAFRSLATLRKELFDAKQRLIKFEKPLRWAECRTCGQTFGTKSYQGIYCSRRCRRTSQQRAHRARKKLP